MTARIRLTDIPVGEGRAVVFGDEQVAVFRLRDGTVRALSALCPHLGGPLADGLADATVVVCPLHGRSYDLVSGAESGGDTAVRSWDVDVDTNGLVSIIGPRPTDLRARTALS
jgi:nitrite reductase (NADH) small subunit